MRIQLSVFLCLFAFWSPNALRGQDLPDVAQGFQPYVAYHGGELDQINTLNGGLTIRIPLLSYPQKGSLSLSYSVIFNSFGYQIWSSCIGALPHYGMPPQPEPLPEDCTQDTQLIPAGPFPDNPVPPGPRVIADQALFVGGISAPNGPETWIDPDGYVERASPPVDGRFYVISADYSEHALAATRAGFQSTDESGYLFVPSATPTFPGNAAIQEADLTPTPLGIQAKSGTITDSHGLVHSGNTITDPDGNQMTIPLYSNTTYPPAVAAVDSVGRTIPAMTGVSYSLCPTLPNTQLQPVVGAYEWTPPEPTTGTPQPYIFCYASVHISTSFIPGAPTNDTTDSHGDLEYFHTITMLQSIVLPDATANSPATYWGFVYDAADPNNTNSIGLGELKQLIYPTGGSMNYTYQSFGGFCPHTAKSNPYGLGFTMFEQQVSSRQMLDEQGNSLGTWTYSYPQSSNTFNGSILSPTGDLTLTKFTADQTIEGCSWLDAGQKVYEGGSASGHLLRETTKSYIFPEVSGPIMASSARESQTITTLDNGSVSSIQTAYAPGITFWEVTCDDGGQNCSIPNSSSTGGSLIPIGGPISKTYIGYDGSVMKQENTTYQWQANPAYLAANMLDIPANTSVLDGSNVLQSQTSYIYDETAYSPGGVRGHATTATEWLNTGSSPTTHTGWNANGEKAYIIDADNHQNINGHTTDYQYNACNGSVLTDTYNALNQHTYGTYDCNTGLLTSLTDSNGNTTTVGTPSVSGYDDMRRILQVNYPDLGSTSFTYADAQDTVTETVAASPDPNRQTQVVFDGFGRERHRYISDGLLTDTVDTTYDLDGRTSSVSNPYHSTQDSIYGLTTYTYDALNRKTLQTQSDGTSTLQWCYDGVASNGQSICASNASSVAIGSWVDSTDESGRHWQHLSDALGRLTAVMEPDPSSNSLALETDYTYNPLGDLLGVNQRGESTDTPRVRSFTYDSLSRLLCASNPETLSPQSVQNACPTSATGVIPANVVSYGYDPNGNVTSKTDARAITTQYGHDALNRVTSKTYSDGVTPSVAYAYDSSAVPGALNTVGRLTSETVANGGVTLSLWAPYSYDAMGRVESVQECTPANCGTSSTPYQLGYTYDLAGNPVSSTNGIPSTPFNGSVVPSVTYGMNYDQAGHLNQLTSSWTSDSNHPAILLQAPAAGTTVPAYDAAGHLQNAMFGTNAQASSIVATLARSYDNRLRVTSETDSATVLLQRPAVASSGSILISGTEAQTNHQATPGTGTITITGTEGQTQVCVRRPGTPPQTVCSEQYDTGYLQVTINGFTATIYTGQGSSSDAIVAASLAQALGASGSPVTASSSSNVVTMTSIATGAGSNYPFTVTDASDFLYSDTALMNGADASTTYDSGTVSVSLGDIMANPTWQAGSSAQTIASVITSAIAASGSFSTTTTTTGQGVSINITSTQVGAAGNVGLSCSASDTAGQAASFGVSCGGMNNGANATYAAGPVYNYTIPTGGYAANGNLISATDLVTGSWSYGYDDLNRLKTAAGNSGSYNGLMSVSGTTLGWAYDSFGNRLGQTASTGLLPNLSQQYTGNHLSTLNNGATVFQYDNAGDVTYDGTTHYAYDAEGRICAASSATGGYVGYIYDGDGNRVAKGTVSSLNCNLSANGFSLTNSYVIDAGNQELTELGATGNWLHSNVFAGGQLLATYNGTDTYFAFNDWLGTKRAELTPDGCLSTFGSLPFGDMQNTLGNCSDATENHFTGKERDTESGLDYFGARYYGSSTGRFMSPDWAAKAAPIPYAKLDNPQSLNLYSYVLNNPLSKADPDGHWPWDLVLAGGGVIGGTGEGLGIGAALSNPVGWVLAGGAAFTTVFLRSGGGVSGIVAGIPNSVNGQYSPATLMNANGPSQAPAPAPQNNMGGGQMGQPDGPKRGSTTGCGSGEKATKAQRAEALKENDGKCVFCSKPAQEADHSIPASRGGDTTTGPNGNLQSACTQCNRGPGGKHALTSEEFLWRRWLSR